MAQLPPRQFKPTYKSRRVCPGLYELTQTIAEQVCVVTITRRPDLNGWIAAASWDRFTMTDPVRTKYMAMSEGEKMLTDRATERGVP